MQIIKKVSAEKIIANLVFIEYMIRRQSVQLICCTFIIGHELTVAIADIWLEIRGSNKS